MEGSWRIDAASAIDADAFAALEAEIFGAASWGAESVKSGLSAAGVASIIACAAKEVRAVGLAMWRHIGDEAEILALGVLPGFRRRAVAAALLDSILKDAEKGGAVAIFLEVDRTNAPAQSLYEKYGFSSVGERRGYYKDGGDALVLKRVL